MFVSRRETILYFMFYEKKVRCVAAAKNMGNLPERETVWEMK
jgi:hypothetical protein